MRINGVNGVKNINHGGVNINGSGMA